MRARRGDQTIDVRGFGDQRALGVTTRAPGDAASAIRLLRIYTAQIAP